MPGNVLQLKIR